MKRFTHQLLLLLISLGGMGFSLSAQTIRTYLSQPSVRMDQQVEVYVEVTGFVAKIRPQFPLLEFFRKGEVAELTGHTTGDGPVKTIVQSYQPLDTGTFFIPAFEVKMDEKKGMTQEQEVHILPGPPASSFVHETLDAWVQASFSRDTCFTGEQVRMELRLYLRESHRKLLQVSDLAQANLRERMHHSGFWVEKPPGLPEIPQKIRQDGHNYLIYTLYQAFLYPLNPGTYRYDSLYLEASRREVRKGASTFEVLSGKGSRFVTTLMPFSPITLVVNPLPYAATQSVGAFQLEAELSPQQVNTGESFELTVTVKGNGNMALLKAPQLKELPSFSYQAPRTEYKIEFANQEAIGTRTLRYELRPAFRGAYDLGPVTFSFFDPARQQIDSLQVASLPIRVQGADKPEILTDPLDSFYRIALGKASDHPVASLPGEPFWVLGLTILALEVFGWGVKRMSE